MARAQYCFCGKVYSPTKDVAKKTKQYYERNKPRADEVEYYQCSYGSWHWSRLVGAAGRGLRTTKERQDHLRTAKERQDHWKPATTAPAPAPVSAQRLNRDAAAAMLASARRQQGAELRSE